MTSWLYADGAAIDDFIRTRRIRTQDVRARYTRILRSFCNDLDRQGCPARNRTP